MGETYIITSFDWGFGMKNRLLVATALVAGISGAALADGHGSHSPVDMLPHAEAGQCFARVAIPAQYEKVPETVVVEEAYERLSIIDAQFAPSSVDVKVKDEGVQYVVRQPRYETVTEQVLIKPAHERLVVTPAQFETVTETIIVQEARKVWKPGSNLSSHRKVDQATGQVYCLVDIPAKTKTVSRRVLVQPEQTSVVMVDAEYATVQKQVLVDRGGVDEVPTAPDFRTIQTQELLNAAHTAVAISEPRTQVVERVVLRAPERFEWVEVLCDTNAKSSSITDLQRALKDRGYYNGPIDGIIGTQTETAVRKFQEANGLPHQGFVTMDTLRALGLHAPAAHTTSSMTNTVSHAATTYSTPAFEQPQTAQRRFQPEIMPQPAYTNVHNAPVEQGSTVHRSGSTWEDSAASMAGEFEAHASALKGRETADQMLANGGGTYGLMTEEDLANVAPSVEEATPLTNQTTFQRPKQYSVRNRLNWDGK